MKNSLINPDDLKPYFYWLGLTFHSCHQLEYGVKTVLVTMADVGLGGFRLTEMIAIIEDEKKKTLGQVLKLLQQRMRLSDEWRASLFKGLDARNRFVHRFLFEAGDRVASPTTRPDVIAEIKAIRKTVLEADRAVQEILQALFTYGGLDWQHLRTQWAEEVRVMNALVDPEPAG